MPYYITPETSFDVIKIFVFGVLAFIFAFWLAPMLISFLYKHKMWRKKVRDKTIDGKELYFFKKFHSHGEIHTPRFGGVLIWTI
ncbi:MAG: hypothetical protein U9P88_01645, partial [Patescibacteria group bacterium]|nr:hypothetical protein [Patescibacteria group bacterium]